MGLNTEQLELEIQRILFKGDTPLVLYALQIARERKVNLRREIIENLIRAPSLHEAILLLQYFQVIKPLSAIDHCLVLIERFPGDISAVAIRTLNSLVDYSLNESQTKKVLKLISTCELDNQTAKLIQKLHGNIEKLPVKWFSTIARHRNPKVRLEATKIMALNARETFRGLLQEIFNRKDCCTPWALVGLWKLGNPKIIEFVNQKPQFINFLAYCGTDPQIISILKQNLYKEFSIKAALALSKLNQYNCLKEILELSLEKAGSFEGLSLFSIAESIDSEKSLETLHHAIELAELSTSDLSNLHALKQLALNSKAAEALSKRLLDRPIPDNLQQAIQTSHFNQSERWLAPLLWAQWSENKTYAHNS